jgi:hypothetical protein
MSAFRLPLAGIHISKAGIILPVAADGFVLVILEMELRNPNS